MWLLLVFFAWPLTEIGLFVTLGGWLGLWLSLGIVIGTTLLGAAIIRMQGVQVNSTVRAALQRGQNPGLTVAKGALNVLAGVLLVLPGFLTDMLGLFLLLPPVQFGLMAVLSRRATMQRPAPSAQPDVIQGEWTRVDTDKAPPSGWTRH
jgi:UPF0716 protein FxsA